MAYKDKQKEKEYSRRYYQEHKERIKKSSIAWGRSEKGKIYFKAYYKKYRLAHLRNQREYYERLKITVLSHYNNGECQCVKCGESRLACLSIDHINGGGNKHRKQLGTQAIHFFAWLKREGFPKGYQTLCMNCQCIKRFQLLKHYREVDGEYGTETD